MLTQDQARELAQQALLKMEQRTGLNLAILDSETMERSWGWVFFWNSREYIQSRDSTKAVFGNSPFIIDRLTGKFAPSGTAHPIGTYIRRYEICLWWKSLVSAFFSKLSRKDPI